MNNKCISGKRSYEEEHLAMDALIQHHMLNDFSKNQGPINIYECEDCGNWHFTSKGVRNALLDDKEVLARIKKERLALQWEQRLK